ncbi:MAG: hypothetical protein BGO41_05125 [Clostridiales bacterium 38-18]|nr:MAG: hypothetical protein BGO41_05125 [Clostridiales bacterium 38-18]
MKDKFLELEAILKCAIKPIYKKKHIKKMDETLIQLDNGNLFLVQRALTEVEYELVKIWLESANQGMKSSEYLLLTTSEGYLNYHSEITFPVRLWKIQYKESEIEVKEIIKSTFIDEKIVYTGDDEIVMIIKEKEEEESSVTPYELQSLLEAEALTSIRVTVGSLISHLSEVHLSYVQMNELTELVHEFKQRTQVVYFDAMFFPLMVKRIRMLLKSSDIGSREKLLMEALLKQHIRPVNDQELEQTALVFFENNLNISETANELYIHRNTLIYRLNKLESITGFDIRKFNDAMHYFMSYLGDKIK